MFSPTHVSSFPLAEFGDCIQTIEYILFLKLLHSVGIIELGTGAYMQGSFLSTCVCTTCCVWRFVFEPPWNGGCIVLSMSMWDTLHHMAKQL